MPETDIPQKLDIKVADLDKEKIGRINKILERLLAEKDKVKPMGPGFTLHVSL